MGLPLHKLTLADFLSWENEQIERHEFHRGEVFAMVGGRRTHERVIANLIRHLGNLLDGSACQVFAAGMKLQVADDTILYPDVMVTCDKADLAAEMALHAPTLVIEVLSPSTQGYDRSQKFALYRQLPSLREYLLIDPDSKRVEAFRRDAADQWLFFDMSQDDSVRAASLGLTMTMAAVFDGVDPPA